MNIKNLLLKRIRRFISSFLFDPLLLLIKLRAIPVYIKNMYTYWKSNQNPSFNISLLNLEYSTYDKFFSAGEIRGHYFFQDLWAARKIYDSKIKIHYDVGSRIDGFIAHIIPFCYVNYIDIRNFDTEIKNLNFIQGNILELPFEDNSIYSLSCLHVIEHIGLGRYGDKVEPNGYVKAAKELSRVLAIGGQLLLGTPIGKLKLCFDAHRVFSYDLIIDIFRDLELLEFNFIPDKADKIIYNADPNITLKSDYGCGLFVFTKKI